MSVRLRVQKPVNMVLIQEKYKSEPQLFPKAGLKSLRQRKEREPAGYTDNQQNLFFPTQNFQNLLRDAGNIQQVPINSVVETA